MLTERSRMGCHLFADGSLDGHGVGIATISSPLHPSSSPSSPSCIHHRVSKMDTLAGLAIKYGVEVSDIKRINGLVTDLQMFAHKSLQIPQPGRHPPSPLSNGSTENRCRDYCTPHDPHNDVLELIQSFNSKAPPCNVSPAMSRLQGYYGLTPIKRRSEFEDIATEGPPTPSQHLSKHRKSRSLMNLFLEGEENSEAERSFRRRQKCDRSPIFHHSEASSRGKGNVGVPERIGKGIAPRPKAGSRTEIDMARSGAVTPGSDSVKTEQHLSLRKSSSTSCLLLEDFDNSSSMWLASSWILKTDILVKPIIDGLPKSIIVRRNKAALD
ncbi:uncharacterized protein LOC122037000 [Zingiber officinale]|uniref:LysM domain-containing protein n=1 Tax=Zingiber officinale TaxID=94328 RepID=A0A8J5HXH3_ZINOF|nr:uncharacterized protein LOC122037000 [Zingiber officinale]KAG6537742.1 hypothetical protein ZIOFF_002838 [Zingiber officinale]